MAVNKVVINDKTVLDLTGDTVTPSDLVEGVTAHDATGMQITGTRPATSGTDTSDADATAADIAKGKTAYVQGDKVTGTVDTYTDGETCYWACWEVTSDNQGYLYYYLDPGKNGTLIKDGARVRAQAMLSNFGDVTAADVAKGKTFTSKAGLKLTGTNTNDADTSDATATADDIAKGKTAYVQGAKVTGTVYETAKGSTKTFFTSDSESVTLNSDNRIYIKIPWILNDEIMRIGSTITLGADATLFGDATAANVAKGKTFTSAAGVKVTGTAEPAESNNNVEAYAITDTSPSVSFQRTDGDIKIWGYGTISSSSGWGGQTTSLIAFAGDKYYKGAAYSSPSSTSLSLSISNGKLSGLPSGLTAINAVVTRGI